MSKCIKIKQGLDIKLAGEASKVIAAVSYAETCAIKPPDFNGLTPKLLVKEGDVVLAGTPVLCDKNNESIRFCSVVSGEVIEIVRGEKRKILEVRILADKETNYIPFETTDPAGLSRQEITDILLASGAWPLIRQRPFATIANPADTPKSIFVPAFDSNPLAPDNDFILQGEDKAFQAGLDALRELTPGTLHLNIRPGEAVPAVFTNATGVQVNTIAGPHPSGNVGVQIHHIDPINKGEVVWYIHPQDVLIIGRLFINGKFDATRLIALTGSQVFEPKYYKAVAGSAVNRILADGRLREGVSRVISGNILSGTKIPQDGYLGFYDTQLTVIPEGHEAEFMGWLAPGVDKFSMSRTFFSWLTPNKKHQLDTNLHGEERPFVVTGEYEKVFPMDIYPVQLIKSILVEDVELMEQLGIYEVAEEDFALCEVVCTSKIKSQEIIRRGLEIIRKEFT
jgi:Na+-transporting NADH:ubiquinone oxidoreductase subunit A